MKYGLDIPTTGEYADPRKLVDLAAEAEEAGLDGFFLWDVLFVEGQFAVPVVDPWIALAAIALCTQRIKIGAMLTPLSRRRPWQVARQTVALDHLTISLVKMIDPSEQRACHCVLMYFTKLIANIANKY